MSYPAGTGRGFDPFAELQALRSELGRLLGSALVGAGRGAFPGGVDVQQDEAGWTVSAALPGVAPEEVAIELDDRELCIRARSEAEVNAETGIGETGSQQRSFEYRLALPADIDPEQIDATMDHGLLTVHLPRSTRRARRTITIGSRGALGNGAGTATGAPPVDGDPVADRELHHHAHRSDPER